MGEKRINSDNLRKFYLNILKKLELPEAHAISVADSLIFCDLRGIDSHGVIRFASYVKRIEEKGTNPWPAIKVISEGPSVVLLDGDNGMGQVVGEYASGLSIEKARNTGASFVGVRKSSHYGAASYYSVKIAKEEMIGFSATNVAPVMACAGGKNRAIGNNPLSVAVQRKNGDPIVLDIAMSEVSGGKIKLYTDAGKQIPYSWIIDKDGKDTHNPEDFFLGGALLPTGAHKGYGLAVILEILSGILTGSAFLGGIQSWLNKPSTPSNIGHCFAALDINNFMDVDEFQQRLELIIEKLTFSTCRKEGSKIYFPGEPELSVAEDRKRTGIPISKTVWESLLILSEKFSIPIVMDC